MGRGERRERSARSFVLSLPSTTKCLKLIKTRKRTNNTSFRCPLSRKSPCIRRIIMHNNLVVTQLIKKSTDFYGRKIFFTVFTRGFHGSLPWVNWIRPTSALSYWIIKSDTFFIKGTRTYFSRMYICCLNSAIKFRKSQYKRGLKQYYAPKSYAYCRSISITLQPEAHGSIPLWSRVLLIPHYVHYLQFTVSPRASVNY